MLCLLGMVAGVMCWSFVLPLCAWASEYICTVSVFIFWYGSWCCVLGLCAGASNNLLILVVC